MRRSLLSATGYACPGFAILVVLALGSSGIGGERAQIASLKSGTARGIPATEIGVASFYADGYHGKPTASGEAFNKHALTAAHRTLKFGTRVKVTHLENVRTVTVRINDRGPFVPGRVIDLSQAAAEELQMIEGGLAQVKLEVLE